MYLILGRQFGECRHGYWGDNLQKWAGLKTRNWQIQIFYNGRCKT